MMMIFIASKNNVVFINFIKSLLESVDNHQQHTLTTKNNIVPISTVSCLRDSETRLAMITSLSQAFQSCNHSADC